MEGSDVMHTWSIIGLIRFMGFTGKPSRFRTAARTALVGIVEHSVQTQRDNRAGAKLGHHGPSCAVIEHTFRAEVMKPPLQTEIARGINAMTIVCLSCHEIACDEVLVLYIRIV